MAESSKFPPKWMDSDDQGSYARNGISNQTSGMKRVPAVETWNGASGDAAPTTPTRRAAEYVRMSTEHQKYSTENQADAIRAYAAQHGFDVVRTYADAGKSGLRLEGREALQRLIRDVETGEADFEAVLVYDVSRWGRFQDADESAYYEYICRRADIRVLYCAEQFENDGSPVATIVKGVKRAMAGEYSRELSAKVFAGQCRLIELGFRQGGPAGYGLRRVLVDEAGNAKGVLGRGEHKSLQTDRVVLCPGPDKEVAIVREIYTLFADQGRSEAWIADHLNARGLRTDLDRAWTRGVVHQILTNEKYIGNNVYNRRSFKLKRKRVVNAPEMWIRADGAFEGIVDPAIFHIAQGMIRERSRRYSDEDMLAKLRRLLEKRGYLSGMVIDEAEAMPSSSAYRSRFGSLVRAYQLVGFTPDRDFRYVEVNRALRALHADVVAEAVREIAARGGDVAQDAATDMLRINDEISVSIVVARCQEAPSGAQRWRIRLDTGLRPDLTVAVRMAPGNELARDYYLLPGHDMIEPRVRLAENNGLWLDAFRVDTLDPFFEMAERIAVSEVWRW